MSGVRPGVRLVRRGLRLVRWGAGAFALLCRIGTHGGFGSRYGQGSSGTAGASY
ncbi:hypothetical protein AB0D37_32055 [Streptomyces sp. NPDC048384]|uniref:hypothetical protein n=1 Tax=unclassified Streptomyces TaxID=2593676 RepID=UPI003423CA2B